MKRHEDSLQFVVLVGTWMGDDLEQAVKQLERSKDVGLPMVAGQMTGSARHNETQYFDYCAADVARYRANGSTSLSLALRAAKCTGRGRVLVPKFDNGEAPWDGLARVARPRLFVWGESDPMMVEPDSRLASGARVEAIKHAGREAWADAPEDIDRSLRDFFQKHGIR